MKIVEQNRSVRLSTYRRAAQWLVIVALAVAVVYGGAVAPAGQWFIAAFAAFMSAAAPFALGVFVGFLFGIPKTRAEPPPPDVARLDLTEPNTNLEQVSDWLTKILIGVGLTQLTVIPDKLQATSAYVAMAIDGGSAGASAVVAAVLVYFSIAGFLWGFLVTRLILEPELDRRQPDPDAVSRLANTPPSDNDVDPIDDHDAAELLRFPITRLSTPDQLIAWGRAKLAQDPAAALPALGRALTSAPRDRRAVENLAFGALYAPSPDGFTRTIEAAREFLDDAHHRDVPDDANLYAYLACAYGQQYRWAAEHGAEAQELAAIRDHAVDAVKRAVALGARWRPLLRNLATPAAGSNEDDLVALARDPELRSLLGL